MRKNTAILGALVLIILSNFITDVYAEPVSQKPLIKTTDIVRTHFYDIERTNISRVSQEVGFAHFVSVINENQFLAVVKKNGVDSVLAIISTAGGGDPEYKEVENFSLANFFNAKQVVVTDLENVKILGTKRETGITYLALGIECFPTREYPLGFRKQVVLAITLDIPLTKVISVTEVFNTAIVPNENGVPLALSQVGGRIALRGPISETNPNFFLTIGDYSYSIAQREKLPKKIQKSLGVVLSVQNGKSEVYSTGHRNPQGLYLASQGKTKQLFETEHGPRGGDELNVLKKGKNYGWPNSSFGTAYDSIQKYSKPSVEGFITLGMPPTFAWVPSIATSDLIQVKGVAYKRWWSKNSPEGFNDLLVATLKDASLWRIRMDHGKVMYTERINIGYRIRSIAQTESGKIILGTDNGPLLVLNPFSSWDIDNENYTPINVNSAIDLTDVNWLHGMNRTTSEILISSVDRKYEKIKVGGKIIFNSIDSRTITNLSIEGTILRLTFSGDSINPSVGGFPNRIEFQ